MSAVQNQRDHQHDSARTDQRVGDYDRDIGPEYVREHGDIKQERRRFAVPVRTEDRSGFADDQDSGNAHKQFFEDHDHNQDEHERIAGNQTDKHGNLRQFIRNGIEDLSQIADHAKMPGNKPVSDIGGAGKQEYQTGVHIFFLKIQPDKNRD